MPSGERSCGRVFELFLASLLASLACLAGLTRKGGASYKNLMNLAARPWIAAVILSLLALSPEAAHAGMTDAEVKEFESYKAQAQKGDCVSQFNLGACYANGYGVAKDDVQAVSWWRKAAEQGDAKAQFNLGICYSSGCGVAKDDVQAVSWWRKAAEQGIAEAQFNMGFRYSSGCGVAKDDVQAVSWFRKAAEQGLAQAQYSLGNVYAKGKGVAKDSVEAYAYLNLAGITLEAARENLSILEKAISRDEIVAGQQRTKQLQKEIEAKMAANKAGK